ncbi:MAG: UDP-N-acetylmuramoyl-L-alanyl-D-glutamate--2,6-diaminopimelate ligase [Leptospirales bacterium]
MPILKINHDIHWLSARIPAPVWGRFPNSVANLSDHSRSVLPETLFIVRPGPSFRWEFVMDALDRGASFLVSDQSSLSDWERRPELKRRVESMAGLSFVEDIQTWSGHFASSWWGDPSRFMKIVGVTGTNGKTTSSFLTRSICSASGLPCGLLGTVVFQMGGEEEEAPQTTPGALQIHSLFAKARSGGLTAVSMEVSSHALEQNRTAGIHFSVVHFTNLTQDHLDYHHDMERYFEAKRRLIVWRNPDGSHPVAVVHIGDPKGMSLVEELRREGRMVLSYGERTDADIRPGRMDVGLSGIRGVLDTPKGSMEIESTLSGHYNLQNIMGAVGTGIALGLPIDGIREGVRSLSGVPGRFERIDSEKGFSVIVDYAHTDDALANLLRAVRPITPGKVITVFGCGGDRDRGKRPRMGSVAGKGSDFVVLTSDNPRTEFPEAILDEVEPGIRETNTPFLRIADRKTAIFEAIRRARPGDSVVIAGKGHENYQILGREKIHFDDREVAREALGVNL